MLENIIPDEILIIPLSNEIESADEYEGESLRGESVESSKTAKAVSTRLSELSTGLKEFLLQVDTLLKSTPDTLSDFRLDEVEVSAGVTVNGKFVLFGIGAEGGMEGGLRFLFKKTPHKQ